MFSFAILAIEYSFYALLAIVPLIFTPSTSELFELPKMFLVYGIAALIFFFWSVKSILAGKLIYRRTILDIPLILFLIALAISTFTSVDVHTSVWGYYSRFNGGLLPTFTYIFLYWAYVSNMTPQTTSTSLKFLTASAALISLYAILEHFGHSYSCVILHDKFDTSCWAPKVSERVFATLGQPNWLAAWLVAILPLSWSLFLNPYFPNFSKSPNLLKFLFLLTQPFLIFTAVLFTKSRSGLLGLGLAIAVFAFFFIPKKRLVRIAFAGLVLVFGIVVWQKSLSNCFDLNPNALTSATGTESCKIRTIVWKGAINIWKSYPIFGSGPETFAYTYYNFRPVEHNLTSEWDLLYNKAHNEFLNYLANTGSVGLSTYLLLIAVSIWDMTKMANAKWPMTDKNKHLSFSIYHLPQSGKLRLAFASGYITILVTNFFGFSVVATSLLFFLFPAFAVSLASPNSPISPTTPISLKKILLLVLISLTSLALLLKTYDFFLADQFYAKAKKYNSQDSPKEAAKILQKSIGLNPWEPKYYDESADAISRIAAQFAENNKTEQAKEFASLSKELSDQALRISPRNVSFWSAQAIYFKKLVIVDPNYLGLAIQSLEKAVILAPTDPTFRLNLAVLYNYRGDLDQAIKTLEETVGLKPNYNEARDNLARLYITRDEKQKAFEQVRYVIEKIDPRDEDARKLLNILSAP